MFANWYAEPNLFSLATFPLVSVGGRARLSLGISQLSESDEGCVTENENSGLNHESWKKTQT